MTTRERELIQHLLRRINYQAGMKNIFFGICPELEEYRDIIIQVMERPEEDFNQVTEKD